MMDMVTKSLKMLLFPTLFHSVDPTSCDIAFAHVSTAQYAVEVGSARKVSKKGGTGRW